MATVRLTGKQFAIFMGVFAAYAGAITGIYAYTAKKNRDNYEDAMWAVERNANEAHKRAMKMISNSMK